MISQDESGMWAAVQARDAGQDGAFVYAVRTTGVFCRPGCPSRRPLRRNVEFYALNAQAQARGYRPCQRCRPDLPSRAQDQIAAIEAACRRIESAETAPDLASLAAGAGLSPHHFHRLFKRLTGVTPKAYAQARRGTRLAEVLPGAATVTEAIYAAGYDTASRFYADAARRLGMAPRAARAGGAGVTLTVVTLPCWLGWMLVATTPRGIAAIALGDGPEALRADLAHRFPAATLVEASGAQGDWIAAALARIEAPAGAEELPLDLQGTLFQTRVWQALRRIPAGETRSYAEVAQAIGQPTAARAVAQACAANPVAVLTPCHRVIGGDGSLRGYAWGPERKAQLLAREGAR